MPKDSATLARGHQSRLAVQAGQATEQGPRPRNEDFAAIEADGAEQLARHGAVAALADGVGGAKGGRQAAEAAVRLFVEGYLESSPALGVKRAASRCVDAANRWVHTIGRNDAALEGMCCTLTALVLRGRQAYWVHVGDSRLYRLREGGLEQLTTDHVVGRGDMRHVLTRAVGGASEIQVEYGQDAAQLHDRYLICSDGVHGALSHVKLRDALLRRAAPAETARQLVTDAVSARGGDNATAVVLDVLDLPPADRTDLAAAQGALPILPPPRSGAVVDGFRLGAMLADGRYSRVFRARDEAGGRDAVLKFPVPSPGNEGLLRLAFLREGWIAAKVRSPFVGEVWELPPGRQSRLYTAMPFYEGETLEQRLLREPRMGLARGLVAASNLCKAVASLHRAGVIHRDIKPENVILLRGEPDSLTGLRLLDLGVARLPYMDDPEDAEAPGTPSYKAPELLRGMGNAAPGDERSDIYALGVTLYRMFTRAYPYGEVEPFQRPRFGQPTPLLRHRPDLPAWLDAVLARAVAEDPGERYGDAVELAFALEHGALQAAPGAPARRPLMARNPLRFWQALSAALAAALLAALALR